jgi:O-antigen/teichoic acid export membrane protein
MIASETTGRKGIGARNAGPVPLRLLFGKVMHTLMPSAVRMGGAGFQFLSTVMVARSLGDGPSALFFFWSSVLMTSAPIATFGLEQIALRNVPRLEPEGRGAVAAFVAKLRAISLAASGLIGLGWLFYAVATEPNPGGLQPWHVLPLFAQGAIALTLINGEALKGLSRPVLGSVFAHVLPSGLFCLFVAVTALLERSFHSTEILALYTASFAIGAVLVRFAPGGAFGAPFLQWPSKSHFRILLREGFPVCCVSLFGALGFIVPLTICEATRPAAEVSHLTTAFRVSILFVVLSGAIHSVFAPALSRTAEMKNPLRPVMKVYGKSIAIALLTLGVPISIGLGFPEKVMTVFGEEFRDGAEALRLLLFVQLLSLMMGPVPYLLLMTGHTDFLARLGILKLVTVVALSFLLIPRYGGTGMIVAMGIAFLGEGIIGVAYAVAKMRNRETREEEASAE